MPTPPSPIFKGTTFTWGTAGVVGSPSGCIVDNFDVQPFNQGPVGTVENGDGALVSKIYLEDGFNATASAVHDPAKTWPKVGDSVTVTIPYVFTKPSDSTHTGTTTYACTLEYITPALKRKQTGMVNFKLSWNPGVEG